MSAVTLAPILKKRNPDESGFYFDFYSTCICPALRLKTPDNIVRTMCSNSYGQNGFNFYLCTSKKKLRAMSFKLQAMVCSQWLESSSHQN